MMRAIPTSERANTALAAPSNDTAEQTQFVRMLKRECKPDQGPQSTPIVTNITKE